MPGIGVLANVVAVLIGGVLGLGGGRFLAERFQATLMRVCALVVIFLGLGGSAMWAAFSSSPSARTS